MRLFIAIDINDAIKQRIRSLIADLRETLREVRWVNEDGIHITLKFLGEVDEEKAKAVAYSLEKVSSRFASMRISISHLGRFPERGSPRVFWIGAKEESGALRKLALNIEEEMEKIGFEKEKREFKPHITLGRVKRYRKAGKDFPVNWDDREVSFGSFCAEHVFLMKSTLRPDGARYEKIGTFAFMKETHKER